MSTRVSAFASPNINGPTCCGGRAHTFSRGGGGPASAPSLFSPPLHPAARASANMATVRRIRLGSYRDVLFIAMLVPACAPAPRFGPPPVDDTYRANRSVFESTVKLGHNVALGQLAGSLEDAPLVAPRANLRSLPDTLGGT